jgi:hypothetical protein
MNSLKIIALSGAAFLLAGPVLSADVFVYPKNGQNKEQQEQDNFACYKWAKEQTGFDPTQPAQQASTPPPQGGQVVGGAARGAALGAIGGAIGGDAGKGAAIGAAVGGGAGAMRKRGAQKQHAAAEQKAQQQQQAAVQTYQRAFKTCMEGKGYTVN